MPPKYKITGDILDRLIFDYQSGMLYVDIVEKYKEHASELTLRRSLRRAGIPNRTNSGPPRDVCLFPDCNEPAPKEKLCKEHLLSQKHKQQKFCRIKGCEELLKAKGLCQEHLVNSLRIKEGSDGPATWMTAEGYICQYVPDHIQANSDGRILQHRAVMAEKMGRRLLPHENVHHINGDRADNRIENLELWIKTQPSGQRPSDLVAWAKKIIEEYEKYV